jgi:hypothetical protein
VSDYSQGLTHGAQEERERIIRYLEEVPPETIDDWGLNAIGNLIDLLSECAHLEEKTTQNGGDPHAA